MAKFQDLVADIVSAIKPHVSDLNDIMAEIERSMPPAVPDPDPNAVKYPDILSTFSEQLKAYNTLHEKMTGIIRNKLDAFKQMPPPSTLQYHSLRMGFKLEYKAKSHEIIGLEITGIVNEAPIGDPTVYSSSSSSSQLP